MAKTIDVMVFGDKQLQRRLSNLILKLQRKVVRKSLREAARPIHAASKAKCPVLTGRLRKSIKLRAMRRARGRFGMRIITGTREELGIPADEPYYYPAAVETGHGNVPAYPFLRPALHENRGKALKIACQFLRQGIEQEMRRG